MTETPKDIEEFVVFVKSLFDRADNITKLQHKAAWLKSTMQRNPDWFSESHRQDMLKHYYERMRNLSNV